MPEAPKLVFLFALCPLLSIFGLDECRITNIDKKIFFIKQKQLKIGVEISLGFFGIE